MNINQNKDQEIINLKKRKIISDDDDGLSGARPRGIDERSSTDGKETPSKQ